MLSTTFLGHQGWMFQSKTATVLVDPLLGEEFGHAHALSYRVFPPRVWTPAELPPIDAVVLSHEHDDHFDIASLAKLDRAIPIFLSSRSSIAARRILDEMGFRVHAWIPGRPVEIGDLELTPFPGDHVSLDCGDEWDTLPFLVKHQGGSGNFFSMVDIPITEQHVEWARARDARPVVVSWTNNAIDWSHMADYLTDRGDATQDCFTKMGIGHKLVSMKWGTPAAMLMCAGGFAFTGDKAWMNERVFCVDTERVCQMLASLYKGEQFHATRPGQTFVQQGARLKRVDDAAPFLTTAPRDRWTSRARTAAGAPPDYTPATGRTAFTADDERALAPLLDELAASLVGGSIFRGLCSLLEDAAPGRAPTFALVLRRDGGDPLVYAYEPSACTFVRGADRPRDAYLAGIECWGQDLLAVLRGELGPIALTYGRARLWNALPQRFRFDLFGELYRVSHPLRKPDAYLRTYQRLWREVAGTEPSIKGRAS